MYKVQFFPKYCFFLSRKIYMLFVVIELQLMVPRKYFVKKKNSLKSRKKGGSFMEQSWFWGFICGTPFIKGGN